MITISSRTGIDALDEYDSILTVRIDNPLPDGEYGEVHHILPKSCGGGNEASNLVKLTPEEHFRCHRLLPLIFEGGLCHWKMVTAFHYMLTTRDGVEVTEEEYGRLKREYSKAVSEFLRGRPVSEETRQKIGASNMGKKRSEEVRRKNSELHRGMHHSDETRQKMSKVHRGRTHTEESKQKMSEIRTGWKHSAETRRRISEIQRGRKLSEETRRKMREAQRRRRERERLLREDDKLTMADDSRP